MYGFPDNFASPFAFFPLRPVVGCHLIQQQGFLNDLQQGSLGNLAHRLEHDAGDHLPPAGLQQPLLIGQLSALNESQLDTPVPGIGIAHPLFPTVEWDLIPDLAGYFRVRYEQLVQVLQNAALRLLQVQNVGFNRIHA